MGEQTWPQWTTAPISVLARDEARNHLKAAQAFWRDFALAGLTIPELRQVIEERRRKGPGGRITVPSKPQAVQPKPSAGSGPRRRLTGQGWH